MIKIIKRMVCALCLLYSVNIVLYNYGVVIPLNIYVIALVSFYDVFGICAILLLMIVL